jgi:hypothetical protein
MKRNSIVALFANFVFLSHVHAQNGNYYKQSANHKIDRSQTVSEKVDTLKMKNTRPGNYKNNFNRDQYIPIDRLDSTSVINQSTVPSSRNYKHSF